MSDAWESNIREDLFGSPWHRRLHTATAETKSTKKFITDEEGTDLLLPKIVEVECRRFYVLSADIEAHGHMRSCPGYALLASQGKATKPREDEFRKRVGTIIERTLTGGARMNAYKDRIAETQQVKERKRARVERGAGDVPMEPGNRADEQVAVRHSDASGGDIIEHQHEEDRMRDIHVGNRGPEAASEEQLDKLRKTVRFEQEAPSASASSDRPVALEYPRSGETQDRLGSVLVQKSSHVNDDVPISALIAFYEKENFCVECILREGWTKEVVASEKCWSGIEEKIPEISREVNQMNWLRIGHVSTPLRRKFGKVIRRS